MMMTYQEAMNFINHIPHIGKRNGVNQVQPCCEKLGAPAAPSVCPVARHQQQREHRGHDGFGAPAGEAGLRGGDVHLPYVEDFRERIQLDGQWISKGSGGRG